MISDEIFEEARQVVELATKRKVTFGCAESCTGGLVSGAVTAVPGSSVSFRGAVVSYVTPVKHDVLGVEAWILDDVELGVVSGECAEQMAQGTRRVIGCDVAVSVTGIAGPGGAEPGKPVGTVWFGLSTSSGVSSECHHFSGSREEVRDKAVVQALRLLREGILKQ
ncbi:MAG: CinA family protein [Atopobiaceae bacterium]|nr:CinA family protein [Atopobiaceae bacterium]